MLKKLFTLITFFSLSASLATSHVYAKTSDAPIKKFSDEDDFESYSSENDGEVYDPLEKYNRKIFAFNDFLDRNFLEYVARSYRDVPRPARNAIRNFLTNLSSPISSFNSLLQGKTDDSLATFSNFLINSTIGIAGIFNVAEEKGIKYKKEDFGQTLGHYGVTSGPYLMMPFIGPSSVRDFGGMTTDQIINPTSYNATELGGKTFLIGKDQLWTVNALRTVDNRESLIEIIDDIKKESFDYYATVRSAYTQKRINEIKN